MKKIAPIILMICSHLLSFRAAGQSSEYSTIMQQVRDDLWGKVSNIGSLNSSVASTLSTLQDNGAWPDINYSSTSATNWAPHDHLVRVKNFALAYTMSASNYYGDNLLHQAIVNSLTYWDQTDPQSSNWWYNEIASPQRLGEILILLRANAATPLSSTLENNLVVQMTRGNPAVQTGANKLDIATHYIYRGCLKADSGITQTGVNEAFFPIVQTTAEGLQHDNSYTQHGQQLHISSYGHVFVDGEINVAMYVRGTSYALSSSKLNLFSLFVRNTYLRAIRGKYMDYNGAGRAVSRINDLSKGGFSASLTKLKVIDPAYAGEYDNAIARLQQTQSPYYMVNANHTHYWRTDYSLHNRAAYSFALRNVSTRTAKSENGNGENLKAYFLTDGATNIAVNGNEYYNIFPVWDWNKIPGVTVPELTTFPVRSPWGVNPGTVSFVGGVSDSVYGATAYAMNDYNVNARKSWFFFDDEVVCLGAAINATAAQAINTTVNQCLLDGNVTVSSNGSVSTLNQGSNSFNGNLQWALHDSVGYFFPQGGNLQLANQSQTGNWYSINTTQANQSISSNVFKLWFKHGVAPSNASYAYVVAPNKITVQDMQNYDTSNIRIMANNSNVQAVKHNGLNVWQIIFYTPGSFVYDSVTIQADQPCVLLLKNIGSPEVTVNIADPAQAASKINLVFNLPGISSSRQLECTMPSAPYAGSGISLKVNSNTPIYTPPPPGVNILPVADAYVRNGTYANNNYGATTSMVVKNDANGYKREAFLKFDLNSVTANVSNAKLKLVLAGAGSGVASTTWEVRYVTNDSWSETGLTWKNRPTTGTLLATVPGKPSGTVEWDITSQVLSELGADKVLSLHISSTVAGATTDGTFNSKETSNATVRPILVLEQSTQGSRLANLPPVTGVSAKDELLIKTRIFPNPLSAMPLQVEVEIPESGQTSITIHDQVGRQVYRFTKYMQKGYNKLELSAATLPVGLYTITVHSGKIKSKHKMIKISR